MITSSQQMTGTGGFTQTRASGKDVSRTKKPRPDELGLIRAGGCIGGSRLGGEGGGFVRLLAEPIITTVADSTVPQGGVFRVSVRAMNLINVEGFMGKSDPFLLWRRALPGELISCAMPVRAHVCDAMG